MAQQRIYPLPKGGFVFLPVFVLNRSWLNKKWLAFPAFLCALLSIWKRRLCKFSKRVNWVQRRHSCKRKKCKSNFVFALNASFHWHGTRFCVRNARAKVYRTFNNCLIGFLWNLDVPSLPAGVHRQIITSCFFSHGFRRFQLVLVKHSVEFPPYGRSFFSSNFNHKNEKLIGVPVFLLSSLFHDMMFALHRMQYWDRNYSSKAL